MNNDFTSISTFIALTEYGIVSFFLSFYTYIHSIWVGVDVRDPIVVICTEDTHHIQFMFLVRSDQMTVYHEGKLPNDRMENHKNFEGRGK